jgi:hypothetical protein
MEAFKAANPTSTLEDFVKWHSPKDWIPDDSTLESGRTYGKLSSRMIDPDNLWQALWKKARTVPARRQSPLFDFQAEGEKVRYHNDGLQKLAYNSEQAVQYLQTLSFPEIFDQ